MSDQENKYLLKIYRLYDKEVETDTFTFDIDVRMLAMFEMYKHFSHVYYIEAGELIYTDTDRTYFRRMWEWIRKK